MIDRPHSGYLLPIDFNVVFAAFEKVLNQRHISRFSQEGECLARYVTCHCEFPPDWIRVRPIKGRTNEEAEIYGRADYCGAEGAGGWREGGRPLPQARNLRSDVL